MRKKREIPFDPSKTGRENLLEWVGPDERISRLIEHCEAHGYPMRFVPGLNWCYIDVLNPQGNPITAERIGHTMTIELDADRVTIFGSPDIGSGIDRIDEIYAEYGKIDIAKETKSLLRL